MGTIFLQKILYVFLFLIYSYRRSKFVLTAYCSEESIKLIKKIYIYKKDCVSERNIDMRALQAADYTLGSNKRLTEGSQSLH